MWGELLHGRDADIQAAWVTAPHCWCQAACETAATAPRGERVTASWGPCHTVSPATAFTEPSALGAGSRPA